MRLRGDVLVTSMYFLSINFAPFTSILSNITEVWPYFKLADISPYRLLKRKKDRLNFSCDLALVDIFCAFVHCDALYRVHPTNSFTTEIFTISPDNSNL